MIQRAEDEEFRLLLVPVGAHAAERTRAVMERVRHDADLGFFNRYDLALKISERRSHP